MGTGGDFPEVKAVGHEADHSRPSSAEVKNGALSHLSSWHLSIFMPSLMPVNFQTKRQLL
jgi:hypothetical protein